MTIHQTFFQPMAVVRTDLETGERTLELDWYGSIIDWNDWYTNEPERSQKDADWVDDVTTSEAFWSPVKSEDNSQIVKVTCLDPTTK